MIQLTTAAAISESNAVAEVTNISINRQAGLLEFTLTFGNAAPAFTPGGLVKPIDVTVDLLGNWSANNGVSGTLTVDQQTQATAITATITAIAQALETLAAGALAPGTVVAG